jgi:hypothetical protein
MRNYWEKTLYPQFLLTIDDCTLSEFTNFEIQNQLGYLVIRAIEDFKFPKISLEYDFDEVINNDTDTAYGYYFISGEVKQKEFNVILARMKQYWIEFQMSQERLFSNVFYDKDIRLHSPGNTIAQLLKMYAKFRKAADTAEYNYGRVTDGRPSIGAINE